MKDGFKKLFDTSAGAQNLAETKANTKGDKNHASKGANNSDIANVSAAWDGWFMGMVLINLVLLISSILGCLAKCSQCFLYIAGIVQTIAMLAWFVMTFVAWAFRFSHMGRVCAGDFKSGNGDTNSPYLVVEGRILLALAIVQILAYCFCCCSCSFYVKKATAQPSVV